MRQIGQDFLAASRGKCIIYIDVKRYFKAEETA